MEKARQREGGNSLPEACIPIGGCVPSSITYNCYRNDNDLKGTPIVFGSVTFTSSCGACAVDPPVGAEEKTWGSAKQRYENE